MDLFLQQLTNGIALGSLYALIAVGYTVVYGIVQLINFAHGEVFMIGAFGGLATWSVFFDGNTSVWVLPVMLFGAVLSALVVAIVMERVAYRPLRNAPRLAPLITAIGVSVFLQEAVRLFYPGAKSPLAFPPIQIVTGEALTLGGVTIRRSALFTIGALLVCSALLWWFINRTKMGRGMQAVSQDPDTARLMGIDVDKIIVVAFALGAVLAGIAGVAQGLQTNGVNFFMGFTAGLKAFTAAVLGGIGNVAGAVFGGLVLGVAESLATQFVPGAFGGTAWKDVWAFVLLILVLVFRPQGLLGARVVDRA